MTAAFNNLLQPMNIKMMSMLMMSGNWWAPHTVHGITLSPTNINEWKVGDRVRLQPAHVDPTIAKHEQMWLVDGDSVVDRWAVDLRHW